MQASAHCSPRECCYYSSSHTLGDVQISLHVCTPLPRHARLAKANATAKRCPSRTTRRDTRICASRNDCTTRHMDRSCFDANERPWLMEGATKRAQTPLRALACVAPASLRSHHSSTVADETWYDCGKYTVVGKQSCSPNTALQLTASRARSVLFKKVCACARGN